MKTVRNQGIPTQFNEQARKRSVKTADIIPPTQIGTSISTLYTVPEGFDFVIENFWALNVDGSNRTYVVHIVASGDTAAADNAIAYNTSLAVTEGGVIPQMVNHRLQPGDTIQVQASAAASINMGGWGFLQSSEE